jgi:hypothetical protein
MLHDDDRDVMRLHILESERPQQVYHGPDAVPVESPGVVVWRTRQPMLIADFERETRFPDMAPIWQGFGMRSGYYLPLTPNACTAAATDLSICGPARTAADGKNNRPTLPANADGVGCKMLGEALLTQDDQPAVMRVESGKAVRTPVRLGVRQGAFVEVLKKQARPPRQGEPAAWEDFTGSEEVVSSAPSALTDGQAVRVRNGSGAVEIALR